MDSTGIDLDNLLRNKTHYCVCTLYRQRSPLSTSFKLCLEETRERDTSNGSFSSSSSKYEPSLVLLGARRSGAISSSFGYVIHSSFDPKNGRDKSGIGRIQRVSGSSGRYLSTSTSLKSYIAIHVSSKSMDKLLRVKAVALSDTFQSDAEEPLTSFSVTSDSLVSVSSATMTTDISPSKGRSGTESGSNSSGAKDITSEELWLLKSLDALVENKIESEIPLFSAVTEKIFTNDTQNHTVPSNSNHESSFQVLKLRSAAPRVRMNTESLKDEPKSSLRSSDSALYNTNFTSGFRAKEASRKNIVIESLQSAGDSVTAFDDEYCPVFQVCMESYLHSFIHRFQLP